MKYCGECEHFQNEDSMGDGNCAELQGYMVNCGDACMMEPDEEAEGK